MPTITRFEDIEAWQTARQLANLIYKLTDQGAFARDYGLKDQIRRAAVSVMSNIAEGFESRTQPLFVDFLGRAKASAGEVRSQLYIALDRRYITQAQFDQAYDLADKAGLQIYRLPYPLGTVPGQVESLETVLDGADVVVVLTDHSEFQQLGPEVLNGLVDQVGD